MSWPSRGTGISAQFPSLMVAEKGMDMWWRPFGMLHSSSDKICAYAPCSEYYNDESPAPSDGNWGDQDY